ncbi:hypothetical protein YC2023_044412 [Brassica napus]
MFYVHLSILFGSFATSIIFGTASLRTFASNQILTATNNFDPTGFIAFEGIPTWWYRGIIENRTYMRYLADKGIEPKVVEVYNDFLLSARMSNHFSSYLDHLQPVFISLLAASRSKCNTRLMSLGIMILGKAK